jgi:hypothetical protein
MDIALFSYNNKPVDRERALDLLTQDVAAALPRVAAATTKIES